MEVSWIMKTWLLTLRRSLPIYLALALVFLWAPSALAASREAKQRAARSACLAGDYAKGVTILSKLFVDTKDPNYIYNQGRCYEQNARYEEALTRFQEYLRVAKNLPDKVRTETESHISECQAHLGKLSPPSAPAAPSPLPAYTVVEVPVAQPFPQASPTSAAQGVQQVAPAPAPPGGSGLRKAGIIVASVGVAALAAGLVFNLKVNSMASDFQKLDGYTDSRESDRKTYETLGWVGYGAGAACVATGAILYLVGLRAGRHSSASLALSPAWVPGGPAAFVTGAF